MNHIALISLTDKISPAKLARTSAALQKQVTRDLGPIWEIQATVDSFPDLQSIPVGYWAITVSDADKIDDANDEGYHWSDTNNQPFAIIKYDETWQLTCSHEVCEMLVDPYGNKTFVSDSIDEGQGQVNYLVEVCDPCEDASFAYSVNGILLSDFYTPHYFDPVQNASVRYSYTGAITQPKQVLSNGYLTWQDPITNRWFQATYFTESITITDITDHMQSSGPVRSRVDRITKNINKQQTFSHRSQSRMKRAAAFKKAVTASNENLVAEIKKFIKL